MTTSEHDDRDRARRSRSEVTERRQQTIGESPARPVLRKIRRMLLLVVFVSIPTTVILCLLAVRYSNVRQGRADAAMEWCDGIVSSIDSYHSEHGVYPDRLEDVANTSSAPVWVRDGSLHYARNIRRFEFDISTSMFSDCGWRWDSQYRQWLSYQ